MRDFTKRAYRISITAMFLALSVIVLYLISIVPTGRLGLYFLSSLFVAPLLVEREPALALILYLSASVLSLFFMANILYVLPYVFLFGHYGIGKYYFEQMRHKKKAFFAKLLYYNATLALIYWVCFEAIAGDLLRDMPIVLLVILVEISFVAYDFLYSKITLFYDTVIRKRLMRT